MAPRRSGHRAHDVLLRDLGDEGHQHFKQPESLALQVRVLNAVSAAAGRPVSVVSLTVPQYQRKESYFAPLAQLTTDPGTELNFTLVPYHLAEQAPGTAGAHLRLIDAAPAASPGGSRDWGFCTEGGMGRAGRDEIPHLLDLHRRSSRPDSDRPRPRLASSMHCASLQPLGSG